MYLKRLGGWAYAATLVLLIAHYILLLTIGALMGRSWSAVGVTFLAFVIFLGGGLIVRERVVRMYGAGR